MKVGMKVGIKFNKIKQNKTIYLIDQGLFACLFIYLFSDMEWNTSLAPNTILEMIKP